MAVMSQLPLVCPFDDDAITVVAFTYTSRPDVNLWLKANGCRTVANGYIVIQDAEDHAP